jgi:hypothetical protein
MCLFRSLLKADSLFLLLPNQIFYDPKPKPPCHPVIKKNQNNHWFPFALIIKKTVFGPCYFILFRCPCFYSEQFKYQVKEPVNKCCNHSTLPVIRAFFRIPICVICCFYQPLAKIIGQTNDSKSGC